MGKRPATKEARNAKMYELRNKGWTLEELAEKYGISRARVDQICKRAKKFNKTL